MCVPQPPNNNITSTDQIVAYHVSDIRCIISQHSHKHVPMNDVIQIDTWHRNRQRPTDKSRRGSRRKNSKLFEWKIDHDDDDIFLFPRFSIHLECLRAAWVQTLIHTHTQRGIKKWKGVMRSTHHHDKGARYVCIRNMSLSLKWLSTFVVYTWTNIYLYVTQKKPPMSI